MRIIGCDLHARQQTVAMLDTTTGELLKMTLKHEGQQVRQFYSTLLRQYFSKRADLSGYTQADLDKVALRLNQRPRKTLGFQTPASRLQESVASTG
jgi:hypothetical protein